MENKFPKIGGYAKMDVKILIFIGNSTMVPY